MNVIPSPLFRLRRAAASLAVGVLAVTGCMTMPETGETARVRMSLQIERPAGETSLKAMVITLASSKGDTLRDTITDHGSRLGGAHVILNPSADQGQLLTPRYSLPHDRGVWACAIESVDARDTLIHQGACEIGALAPGEVRDIALRLSARVAAYEAVFHPHATAPDGARITLARFELDVDGLTHCTTSLEDARTDGPVKIGCDYLPAGPRDVATRVYGRLGEDGTERLLWSGRKSVEIKAGSGRAEPLALIWEANPEPAGLAKGNAHQVAMNTELRLGRVGHVVFNVITPAAVML